MGGGYAQMLPMGDYVVTTGKAELAQIGPEQGKKRWMLFVHLTVEQSSNPTVPIGFEAKTSRFLESDYNSNRALGEVKALVGMCLGYTTAEDLDNARPDWPNELNADPFFLAGAQLTGSVRQKVNKDKTLKSKPDGSPDCKDTWQRIA